MDVGEVLVPELGEKKKKKKVPGKDVDSLFAALDLGDGSEEAQSSALAPPVPPAQSAQGERLSARHGGDE